MCSFIRKLLLDIQGSFYLSNSARFLIVLTGNATRPTNKDMMVFIRKYNTHPNTGKKRNTCGVIRVKVFQPATNPSPMYIKNKWLSQRLSGVLYESFTKRPRIIPTGNPIRRVSKISITIALFCFLREAEKHPGQIGLENLLVHSIHNPLPHC